LSDFNHIYEVHKKMVYNLSLMYVLNSDDALDVTQDVFIKVYEKMNSFRNEAELSTWIYRITVNTSVDFIRNLSSVIKFRFRLNNNLLDKAFC
jgi:RNA polymerase sigma factor (sigma-70 family)